MKYECVCVNRSPYWAIRPSYEVVNFQPWSGIDTVLDSVTFIPLILASFRPTCFNHIIDIRLPPHT